jgi:hypothetical protein
MIGDPREYKTAQEIEEIGTNLQVQVQEKEKKQQN